MRGVHICARRKQSHACDEALGSTNKRPCGNPSNRDPSLRPARSNRSSIGGGCRCPRRRRTSSLGYRKLWSGTVRRARFIAGRRRGTDPALGRNAADAPNPGKVEAVHAALVQAPTARVEACAGVEALVALSESNRARRLLVRTASGVEPAGTDRRLGGEDVGERARAALPRGLRGPDWRHAVSVRILDGNIIVSGE